MKVYHGTTTWKMHSLVSGDFSKNGLGLFVTDTFERAACYANTQASREVTQQALPLHPCAVVVEIEVGDVKWLRRTANHGTLDTCEAVVKRGRLTEVTIGRPGRLSHAEHRNVEAFCQQLPDVSVRILAREE